MKKKVMYISFIILIFLLIVFLNAAQKVETTNYKGTLKKIGDDWYLNTGDDFFKLNLAPEDFLFKNGIELKPKSGLNIYGILEDEEIIVHNIQVKGSFFPIRDEKGIPLWEKETIEKKYYIVNPKLCIGCRLCEIKCPVKAIKMINGVAVIDADLCTGCGICVNGDGKKFKGCPVGAIKAFGEIKKAETK